MRIHYQRLDTDLDRIKTKEYYDEAYHYLLAIGKDSEILGALGYMMEGEIFSIEALYVEPEYRGRGIAGELMTWATFFAAGHGCKRLIVSAALEYSKQDDFARLMLSQCFPYPSFGEEQYQVSMEELSHLELLHKEIKINPSIQLEQIQPTEIWDCKKMMQGILNPDMMTTTVGKFESKYSFRLVDKSKNIQAFIIMSSLYNGDLYIDACMLKNNAYIKEFMRMLQLVFGQAVKKKEPQTKLYITMVSDSSKKLVEHFLEKANCKKYIYAEASKII